MNSTFHRRWARCLGFVPLRMAEPPSAPAPAKAVARARAALRAGEIVLAQSLLAQCREASPADPAVLNLLGLAAEARGDWRVARWFWVRAARSKPPSEPARHNLRRYYELFQWGRCHQLAAYGDEPRFDPLPASPCGNDGA